MNFLVNPIIYIRKGVKLLYRKKYFWNIKNVIIINNVYDHFGEKKYLYHLFTETFVIKSNLNYCRIINKINDVLNVLHRLNYI